MNFITVPFTNRSQIKKIIYKKKEIQVKYRNLCRLGRKIGITNLGILRNYNLCIDIFIEKYF